MRDVINKLNERFNRFVDKSVNNYHKTDHNYHTIINNNNNIHNNNKRLQFSDQLVTARNGTTYSTKSLPRSLTRKAVKHRPLTTSNSVTVGGGHTLATTRNYPHYSSVDCLPPEETMASDMTLAPIRSLDDYLLSVNRFQLPQLKDLDKWNHRVVNNLLYYQTNYFLTAIIIFTLIGIIKPTQMLLGLLALLIAIAIFIYANNKSPQFMDFKRSHPIISLMLIFGGGSLIVYLFSAVLVFLFGVLLPLFLVLLHASLRTRNLKNKMTNTMENMGILKTPMGILLDSFGSDPNAHFY